MDYPILLTPDGKYEAILNRAYGIIVEDELLTTSNGYETLTFLMSNYDKKRYLLNNERMVQVQGRRYVIRIIEDVKGSSNICTVTCDAAWYDLNDGDLKYLMHTDKTTIDAKTAVAQQLEGTGWKVGTVDVEGTRPRHTSESKETSLYNLRQISGNFGGDLQFDTVNSTVSLLAKMGVRHQKIFCYEKNTTSIKRTVDTRNLFTRFTLIGKDAEGNDITVASINGGKEYVENFEWYDWAKLPRKIKWYRKTDDRWSNKQNMLEYMNNWLASYSKPIIGYELNVSLFEVSPNLGDYVYVYDRDLNIGNWLRIVSRKKNILEPHLSTVQLESTKKSIVETIVSTQATTQQTQDIVTGVVTPNYELKLPAGTEDWIMQYKNGAWKAQPVVGAVLPESTNGNALVYDDGWKAVPILGSVLPMGVPDYIMQYTSDGWTSKPIVGTVLPLGTENHILQFVDGAWKSVDVIGNINSLLDTLNGEVL